MAKLLPTSDLWFSLQRIKSHVLILSEFSQQCLKLVFLNVNSECVIEQSISIIGALFPKALDWRVAHHIVQVVLLSLGALWSKFRIIKIALFLPVLLKIYAPS